MGKLIIIEGGDGAGKGTQVKLLEQTIINHHLPVVLFDFPRYKESVFGQLLGRALSGAYGDFLHLSPYLSSLPYILDRVSTKDDILTALQTSNVLCNRYTTSNIAYQAAKLPLNERRAFIEFIETGEYTELKLPKPDIVVYLSVSAEKANELIAQKAQREHLDASNKDQHESALDYLAEVRSVYLGLAQDRPGWHVINCMQGEAILSPDVIQRRIVDVVLPLIIE